MAERKKPERYVAFLKGINVGGHTVKMDRLRELFAKMEIGGAPLGEIETYIASGNIIFSSPVTEARRIEAAIASNLHTTLGYAVPAFVRDLGSLSRISAMDPFLDREDSSLYIAFLPGTPDLAVSQRVEAASTATDLLKIDRSELYWLCRTRFSDSPFSGPALEKLLGTAVTVRNSTTVRKLAEKYGVPLP